MTKFKQKIVVLLLIISLSFFLPTVVPFVSDTYTVEAANLNTYYKKITKGTSYTLKMNGTSKKITWSSSNKKIATVNSKGKITAKKAGTVFITAKIGRSKYTAKIVVTNPPVKISNSNVTLIKGNTTTLKMQNTKSKVTWSSSNKKIATVNSKGKVTAIGKGTTYIKAKVGKKTYSCKITVQIPYFSLNNVTLYTKETKLNPLKGTSKGIKYQSSNSSIAKVDSKGKITGIKAGSVTITATVDKKSYRYKVTVKNKTPSLFTGWKTINGKKYYYENNVMVKGMKDINGKRYYFNNNGILSSQFGIDVSEHQGKIDWDKVKASGVEFAIIRAGYGMDQTDQDDSQFLRNIAECKRLGIPYGIYLYSYANTLEKGLSEAQHILRLIKTSQAKPSLGIWYDIEDKIQSNLEQPFLAQIIHGFASKMEENGYNIGIYANLKWLTTKLDSSITSSYPIWLAHWTDQTSYPSYQLWQYTSSGSISGINGNVDFNIRLLK